MDVEVTVVGAGVLGLASAAALSGAGHSVLLLERHEGPGRETSSRNSEVIHAGIYYPPGSLKARLCVRGNRLLYRFCEDNGVAHKRLGKVIVAADHQEAPALEQLSRTGAQNGASPLRLLDRREVNALEPNVKAVAGLLSPSTGIVDSHGLMKALEGITRARGGQVAYHCEVTSVQPQKSGFEVTVKNPSGAERVTSRVVVNAAGLDADLVAAMAGVDRYHHHWCKGDYFSVSGRRTGMVSRLVYPMPGEHLSGLGVHVTLDLAGRMRLGPDAAYLTDRIQQLDVEPSKAGAFCEAVNRYLPQISIDDLSPDMAGIRPKLQGPGQPWRDFALAQATEAGLPGLINLVGMESPGLTSCLAVGEEVLRMATTCL